MVIFLNVLLKIIEIMKKFLFFLSFVLLSLCTCMVACTESPSVTECEVIDVKQPKFTNWASLLSIEEVVPLENTNSSLLTVASKCRVEGNLVLFQDFKLKSMFVFDKHNGKFKYEVGKVGYSESEHVDFLDFTVDTEHSLITILDERGTTVFDENNGKFLRRDRSINKSGTDYCRFMVVGNDTLLYSPYKDYSISKLSQDKKIEDLRKCNGIQMENERFFSMDDNNLVLPDYGCFVIDTYKKGKLYPKYLLDFGSEALPEKYISDKYDDFEKTDNMKRYFKSVQMCFENSKWLYALVVGPQQKYYMVFYDKNLKKAYAGPLDIELGISIVDVDETGFWALVYPMEFSGKSPFYPSLKDKLKAYSNNPMLVKIKLNEQFAK